MCARDVGLTLFFLRAHAEVRPYRIIVQIVFCSLLILLLILLLMPSFNGMGLVRCLPPPSRGRSGGDCLGNRGQLINPPQLPLSKREKCTGVRSSEALSIMHYELSIPQKLLCF